MATAPVKNVERPGPPKFATVEEERRHRKERLAASFRLFSKCGFDEGVTGHITARDPERLDHFWVNPFGMHFSQIRVSDLMLVNAKGEVVEGKHPLNGAAFASRLPNGHTLITDSNNNRIIEVTHAGSVVFMYATNTRAGSMANPLPTRAVRLRNGNTLISDQFNDQVIEINARGKIVFSQGKIDTDGKGFDRLNAPYDAKVVGDYTGLTPPFDDDEDKDKDDRDKHKDDH